MTTSSMPPRHHDGRRFKNLYTAPIQKGPAGFLKMRLTGDEPFANHKATVDRVPIARPVLSKLKSPSKSPMISWLGHSTFLIQFDGFTVLTDPVFSERTSPLSFAGPKRLVPMPIKPKDLPEIDYVLISHNHYDHLDAGSIEILGNTPQYLVPLGLKKWFTDFGIGAHRVIELDWWQSYEQSVISIMSTPAQHWSGRSLWDRCETLWCSWHMSINGFSFWFAGDTGYNDKQFKEIAERTSPIDLALIPIGAYSPRWFMRQQHVNPEEAIKIHQEIGAKQSIGMHWGTFQLSAEPIDEPLLKIKRAEQRGELAPGEFSTMAIGEIRELQ